MKRSVGRRKCSGGNGGYSCASRNVPERSVMYLFDLCGQLKSESICDKVLQDSFNALANAGKRRIAKVVKCFLITPLLPSKTLAFKGVLKTIV